MGAKTNPTKKDLSLVGQISSQNKHRMNMLYFMEL